MSTWWCDKPCWPCAAPKAKCPSLPCCRHLQLVFFLPKPIKWEVRTRCQLWKIPTGWIFPSLNNNSVTPPWRNCRFSSIFYAFVAASCLQAIIEKRQNKLVCSTSGSRSQLNADCVVEVRFHNRDPGLELQHRRHSHPSFRRQNKKEKNLLFVMMPDPLAQGLVEGISQSDTRASPFQESPPPSVYYPGHAFCQDSPELVWFFLLFTPPSASFILPLSLLLAVIYGSWCSAKVRRPSAFAASVIRRRRNSFASSFSRDG